MLASNGGEHLLTFWLDPAKSGVIECPVIVGASINYHNVGVAFFEIIIGFSLIFVGNLVGVRYVCKHKKKCPS